jgi:protein phosphatase
MPTITVTDPSVILLVGPAGSGKSTLAQRHFAPDEVLSSDAMRAIVGRGESDQNASKPAFALLHRQLRKRLAAGRLTVVDATNLSPRARSAVLRLAHAHRMPAVAIVLDLPAPMIVGRSAGRVERRVDRDVVLDQLARLREVVDRGLLEREGFVAVFRIREPAEVDALRVERRGQRR